jgi:hypothetical protein
MTIQENTKCIKVLDEAIKAVKQAKHEFTESERFYKEGDEIKAEIEQRKADNHMGYAEGINQVLATLGFKHSEIIELQKLLLY